MAEEKVKKKWRHYSTKEEKEAFKNGIRAGNRGAKVWAPGESPFAKRKAKKAAEKDAKSDFVYQQINTKTGETKEVKPSEIK